MKKLMIAAAIVCAAVFAQAANCNWTTYAYDSSMVNPLEGGTYYIVSLGASDAGLADLKVFADGTTDWGSYTQVGTGSITGTAATYGQIGGTLTGLSEADNGAYYALVVYDGKGADGFYGKAAGKIEGIIDYPPTDAKTITFDNSGAGFGATLANTATEAVPEPTSGLLLLLGVAGLALRRRRA